MNNKICFDPIQVILYPLGGNSTTRITQGRFSIFYRMMESLGQKLLKVIEMKQLKNLQNWYLMKMK